jgi:hypothetical protein
MHKQSMPDGISDMRPRPTTSNVAVAHYYKGDTTQPKQPPLPHGVCPKWTATKGDYHEAIGVAPGNVGSFSGLTVAQAEAACCKNSACAGFSFNKGGAFYKRNALAGFVNDAGNSGAYKANQIVPPTPPDKSERDIALIFTAVNLRQCVRVRRGGAEDCGQLRGLLHDQGGALPRHRVLAPLGRLIATRSRAARRGVCAGTAKHNKVGSRGVNVH